MPRKKPGLGVDLNDLVRKGAKQLLAQRDELRRRELSGADKAPAYEPRAQVCVDEHRTFPLPGDPYKEPRIEWTVVGSMPFDLPEVIVRASLSEAVKNRQSIRDLLKRRWKRGYRQRLLEEGICEHAQSAHLAQLVDITVIDTGGMGVIRSVGGL